MALILHPSSSSCVTRKSHPHHLLLLQRPKPKPTYLSIKSQSQDPSPAQPSSSSTEAKKPDSTGQGFGSSTSSKPSSVSVSSSKKKKQKGERASVIRRAPIQKPDFGSEQDVSNAQLVHRNESAFLLAWLGLGVIILVQGIALAASGFLPEEWDNFFVKYLYPSFTPTVGLFVAGTVVYGVLKYLQNERFKSEK